MGKERFPITIFQSAILRQGFWQRGGVSSYYANPAPIKSRTLVASPQNMACAQDAFGCYNVMERVQIMTDFGSVLSAAQQLPEHDRLRLIDALWATVPPEHESFFSEEWVQEIERRTAELDAGTGKTVPWSQVRRDALARIDHGQRN
jgi:putative addiction module component (TIGR02574 family)